MSDYLTDSEIEEELKQLNDEEIKNDVINPIVMAYPYTIMDPFLFELLTYKIFSEDKEKYFNNKNVKVYPGNRVADKGKDVVVKDENGNIISIIQCKRYNKKVSTNLIYSEITKTVLNFFNDNQKVPKFKSYYFVSPFGITSDVQDFLPLSKKFDNTIVDKCAEDIFKHYPTLRQINYDSVKNKLYSIIKKIDVTLITAADLDEAMIRHPNICKMFFRVESVIDIESFKKILDSYFKRIKNANSYKKNQDFKLKKCQNANKLNKFFECEQNDPFYMTNINIIAEELENIRKPARMVFSSIMKIIKKRPGNVNLTCRYKELLDELPTGKSNIFERLEQLKEFGFINFNDLGDQPIEEISISSDDKDKRLAHLKEFFEYIIEYSKKTDIDFDKVFIEKDFTVFDD